MSKKKQTKKAPHLHLFAFEIKSTTCTIYKGSLKFTAQRIKLLMDAVWISVALLLSIFFLKRMVCESHHQEALSKNNMIKQAVAQHIAFAYALS